MKKNLLKEEIAQMKYLLGYKAGLVISEQSNPAQTKLIADFNEGDELEIDDNVFGLDDLRGKTINLYDDAGKQVWDQTWYIVKATEQNYGKTILFNLNKDLRKNGTPSGPSVGTMTFDCYKPNYFTVNYDFKGEEGLPNVSNEERYNPDVTTKLKNEYCPRVLSTPAANADFANKTSNSQPSDNTGVA